MSDHRIRELFVAEAGTIGPPSVDLDDVIARERRAMLRRRGAIAAAALAVVTAFVLITPTAITRLTGTAGPTPPSRLGTASAAPGMTMPPEEVRQRNDAVLVLRDHLGVQAQPRPMPGTDWTMQATGERLQNGAKAVTAWVMVLRGVDDVWPPPKPCADCPQHQQPDGSVVSIGPEQPLADGEVFVEVILFRPDRTDIGLGVKYHLPEAQFARFPDNVLVATVTDPRLAPIE